MDLVAVDENTSLTVYPNPSEGASTIKFYSKLDQSGELRVVHLSGKEVYNTTLDIREGENYIELDGSSYPLGLYTVFLDFEKTGRKSTKLLIIDY